MARLDGKKPALWPYILGLAVLAALGAGVYFYSQSSGVPTPPPAPDAALNTASGETTPTTTETAAAPDSSANNAATPNSTSEGTASTTPEPEATSATDSATTPTVVPTESTSTESNSADSTPAPAENTAPVAPASATDGKTVGNTNNSPANDKKDIVSRRSKTITNSKNGTTVTYTKEVHGDGSVTKNKSTGTTPVQR